MFRHREAFATSCTVQEKFSADVHGVDKMNGYGRGPHKCMEDVPKSDKWLGDEMIEQNSELNVAGRLRI